MPEPTRRVHARLSGMRPVFAIEAPTRVASERGRAFWELSRAESDVIVCSPRVSSPSAFSRGAGKIRMVRALLGWFDIDAYVAWLYAPPAPAFLRALAPTLVIHDQSLEVKRPSVVAERAERAARELARAETSTARRAATRAGDRRFRFDVGR